MILGLADQREEGEQEGEVGATEALGLAGADRRGVAHVGDDAVEVEVVGEEGAPVEVVAGALGVGEAQRAGHRLDQREPVPRGPLVDGGVARVERGLDAPRLAGAVAAEDRRVGEGLGHAWSSQAPVKIVLAGVKEPLPL